MGGAKKEREREGSFHVFKRGYEQFWLSLSRINSHRKYVYF